MFHPTAVRKTSLNPGRHAALLRGFSAASPSAPAGGLAAAIMPFLDPEASFAALPGTQAAGVARRKGTAGLSFDSRARCLALDHPGRCRQGFAAPRRCRTGTRADGATEGTHRPSSAATLVLRTTNCRAATNSRRSWQRYLAAARSSSRQPRRSSTRPRDRRRYNHARCCHRGTRPRFPRKGRMR